MNHEAAQATFRSCTLWRKSSYSISEKCVEVITELPGWVGVRDSQLGAASPVLAFTTAQWQTILRSARVGKLARLTDRRAEDPTRR